MESRMSGRLGFNLFLLAVAAYFVWSATGYEPAARRIPVMIGLIVLALQAWVTVRELRWREQGEHLPGEARRVLAMAAWMALFFALFAVLGTLAALFAFLFLFLVSGGRLHWWGAAALGGALSGGIWLVFVRLMRFELYPGILFGAALPPL